MAQFKLNWSSPANRSLERTRIPRAHFNCKNSIEGRIRKQTNQCVYLGKKRAEKSVLVFYTQFGTVFLLDISETGSAYVRRIIRNFAEPRSGLEGSSSVGASEFRGKKRVVVLGRAPCARPNTTISSFLPPN